MQQKYVPQKNSQNRRLLREALVEGNPSHSDMKMTSRGPGQIPHENLTVFLCFTIYIKLHKKWLLGQGKPPTGTTRGGMDVY
ncbi:hypothetical protein E2C01_096943 [Portunus trituberculatus]|uniref:Uncharacterized protein n=1 Tax=Portunus trituberculatus TaxID=210409 RepID=A0A5B7K3C0_PORTR|nr:hypothetical protein [Portunus trituberculatus]